MSRRRIVSFGLAIFLLALGVRVAYVLSMRSSPAFEQPQMDALYHWQWARAFAEGREFQPGPFFRAPLYPWFLGAQLALFGPESFLAPRLVQCVLGALAAVLAYGLARRMFDHRRAVLAGLLVATHWVLVYFDGELLIPTLIVPLDLAALWATTRLADRPTAPRAAAAGVLWGVACIARPNPLALMPLFLGWLWLRARRTERSALAPIAAWCLGLLLPIAPIAIHNAAAGDAVLISSQAGVNFWIGNNPASDGSTAIVPGTRADWWGGYHDAIALAEAAEGRALRPSEVSRHWFGRAFAWMRSDPRAALRLLAWKARLFVTDWELGNNQEVRFFAWRFGGLARYLPPGFGLFGGFGLLLGLGLVGLWIARGRPAAQPAGLFVLGYAVTVIAFFVCSRFRVPVVPLLAIFGAHAVVGAYEALRARRFRAVALGAGVVLLVTLGSNRIPASIETSDANGLFQLGQLTQTAGRNGEALAWYERAVAADPDNRIALRALGSTRVLTGRPEEAVAPLRTAFELGPSDPDTLYWLTDALVRSERTDEALAVADEAARRAPRNALVRFQVGRLQARLGRSDDARQTLAAVLELDPGHFDAAYSLGLVEAQSGRVDEALTAWDAAWRARARASDPDFVRRTCIGALELVEAQDGPPDQRADRWRDRLRSLERAIR